MTLIRELIALPEAVRKGDFVLVLSEGIRRAEQTVASYAITPNLLQAFERALGVIGSGVRDGRSQAAYLHGSFGSGKSHFMAMLDLMLEGHPAVWDRSELHPLREKFDWLGKKRVLRLPFHLIGAKTIEQKVFQTYVQWASERHPDAPIPALFGDQDLFENARQLRSGMGDEKFFAKLNEAVPGGGEGADAVAAGWGKVAKAGVWDAERFDEVVASTVAEKRAELFSALVKSHFPAFAKQGSGFIELDRGLGVMSAHAAGLGYDGVVLFLDELILWLAGHLSNRDFVQNEAAKLAKLKEAQHENREVPLVSFIARQRDLADLVGHDAIGSELASLQDSLAWSSGRFETIVLEDRNLPAIVSRRVLRPRDEAARETIADGFVKVRRGLGAAWQTLLGSFGEEADFKQVYPFSPALVETLVALSNCLQRERTAIRILMELLVEHLEDLELGDVVPVGDVFDVIAGGEDAFDQVMRDRFERAKRLYQEQFLPLLWASHETGTRDRCQRQREDHPARLGCSGCPEVACRNDNRLIKTALLAALVPEAGALKDLSVSRLVHLNHGIVKAPIPGTEVTMVAERFRRWAAQVGQLRVGDQTDPSVSVSIEGVDLAPILQSGSHYDTLGARKRLLREILFEALELPKEAASVVEQDHPWRGTSWPGAVRFGNVRELADQALTCPADAEWFVVIDYPFDEPGHTPVEDVVRVERFLENQEARTNPTMVWMPDFFSERLDRELGQLVVLNAILSGDNARKHLGHLRTDDQARARLDLDSLRNQKHAQVRRALDQAYGLVRGNDDTLVDPSQRIEEHVVSLHPGLKARPLLAGSFSDGLHQLAERLLEARYPHHPRFGGRVTVGKLEKTRDVVERLLDAPDQRLSGLPAAEQQLMDAYAGPLGLAQLSEGTAILNATRLREIDQQRERVGTTMPEVEQVRGFVDPQGTLGLPLPASDLMVYVYTLWSGRSLEWQGKPYVLEKLGKLPDDVQLVKPDLPSETEWKTALDSAGRLFGVTFPGRARTAANLTKLASELGKKLDQVRAVLELPSVLGGWLERWSQVDPPPPRLETARSGAELVERLAGASPADQVRVLAAFEARTSPTALAHSIQQSENVTRRLRREETFLPFESVAGYVENELVSNRSLKLLEDLRALLDADEINQALDAAITGLVSEAADIIRAAKGDGQKPPPARWKPVSTLESELKGRYELKETGEELLAKGLAEIEEKELQGEFRLEIRVFHKPEQSG